jgi:hypothetical protein
MKSNNCNEGELCCGTYKDKFNKSRMKGSSEIIGFSTGM